MLTPWAEKVLEHLKKNPGKKLSKDSLANATELSEYLVGKALIELQEVGFVELDKNGFKKPLVLNIQSDFTVTTHERPPKVLSSQSVLIGPVESIQSTYYKRYRLVAGTVYEVGGLFAVVSMQ